ncbi:protein phosphatase 2C family protein [Artemisia annua]|uniref:Protein phosphatase n=1 Tax=Artemisia annua TaxID=35608 RepID=A0A2U1LEH4_ARTAN|nr:protein phosphatase 2C family protein [Artemisia annua]
MSFYVLSVCNRSCYLFAVEFTRIEDLFGDESIKLSSNTQGYQSSGGKRLKARNRNIVPTIVVYAIVTNKESCVFFSQEKSPKLKVIVAIDVTQQSAPIRLYMDAEKKSNRPGFDLQMAYGILCEKASTFLFRKGFKEVTRECILHRYHLSITILLSATMSIPANLIMSQKEYIIRQISQNGLGSCYLPHPDKEDTCGKDTHFISSDEQATRVADGVGGSADPGIDVDKYDEPKGFVDPARILDKPYINTKAKGSSIACIIMLTNQLYNQLKDLFLARVRFSNINLLRNRKGKLTGAFGVQERLRFATKSNMEIATTKCDNKLQRFRTRFVSRCTSYMNKLKVVPTKKLKVIHTSVFDNRLASIDVEVDKLEQVQLTPDEIRELIGMLRNIKGFIAKISVT